MHIVYSKLTIQNKSNKNLRVKFCEFCDETNNGYCETSPFNIDHYNFHPKVFRIIKLSSIFLWSESILFEFKSIV